MTLDGVCDHTKGVADEETHEHYRELISNTDAILYGRITYQLMEFWRPLVENPSGEKAMDDFAVAMDRVPKIVFSRTLAEPDWESARLATRSLEEEVAALKQQEGADILVGSRSLIISLLKSGLIDEFQLMVQPVIAGGGMALFEAIQDRMLLKLTKTKTFGNGSLLLYYAPADSTR